MGQDLGQLVANFNVACVMLGIGLWAADSAFYFPGTGLLKPTGIICLVLVIAGFPRQPANAVGLILIVVAGLLFAVEPKVQGAGLTLAAKASLGLCSVPIFPRTARSGPQEARAVQPSAWPFGDVTLVSFCHFGAALPAVAQAQHVVADVSPETNGRPLG